MITRDVKFNLNELKVNRENFRHSPLTNETEAIKYLIDEDIEAYYNLAKSIKEDCRSFSALILKKENEYILMDANRRVSVLKIFSDPKLIPSGKKYDKLRRLCAEQIPIDCNIISADVYDDNDSNDRQKLLDALDSLHIDPGRTQKNWNALSQYRASMFIGAKTKHPWIKVLLFYKYSDEEIVKITHQRTDIFNRFFLTNKFRIQSDGSMDIRNAETVLKQVCKAVKERTYFSERDQKLIKINTRETKETFESVATEIIDIFSLGQSFITSSTSHERVSNIINHSKLTPTENPLIPSQTEEKIKQTADTAASTPTVIKSPTLNLADEKSHTIITSEQYKEISHTTSNNLNRALLELSLLNVDNVFPKDIKGFKIAGAVLLRSALEFACKYYIDNNNLGTFSSLDAAMHLVLNDLFNKAQITKLEKTTIKTILNGGSTNLLNGFVHDININYNTTALRSIYTACHPMIKNINYKK